MNRTLTHIRTGFLILSSMPIFPTSAGWAQTIPKSGVIDATYIAAATNIRWISAGGNDAEYLFEATLLLGNNSKTPLFQNVSAHCVEAGFTGQGGAGYCVYTDKDGDKFVDSYSYAWGSTSGKATLISGTGKYKGIQGQNDWQQVQALPAEKGSVNFVGHKTGSYRLP